MLIIFDLDGTLFKTKSILPDFIADPELYRKTLLRNVRERGELFDGVYDALRELKNDGYALAVCSASEPDYIETALTATGIRGFFDSVCGSGGRDMKVPVFKTLAGPGLAIAVGDTWRDMEAARECGFYRVAALYGYGKRELITADSYIMSASELPRVIREAGKYNQLPEN